MTRSFSNDPVPAALVDQLLADALRVPSAGNSQGADLVVLEGADTARYWDLTLPGEARANFGFPGLLKAPVLVVVVTDPSRYVDRYAEPDKAGTKLGVSPDSWPTPFWFVDAGMVVLRLLDGAVDSGLGACFFGLFADEAKVLDALGVPDGFHGVGTVALGVPDGQERPGRSASRRRRSVEEAVHRGRWHQ